MIKELTDPGLYFWHRCRFPEPTPAIFFDRDGVLVEDTNYLHRLTDLVILPAAATAIQAAQSAHRAVVLVTNQAGIARGFYGWHEFHQIQQALTQHLHPASATPFDGVWACGYHADGQPPLNRDHPWRKPHPGMLTDAARTMNIDLAASWLIGDKLIDLEAGIAAGLAGVILVRTGYGRTMEDRLHELPPTATRIETADDAAAAVERILSIPRV
jgi:D-glycero-D-manno-heptose 1,7-bisphosphate phosphatase